MSDAGKGAVSLAFGKRHVVLAVIHTASLEQASRNARVARDAGADGVFLINHSIDAAALISIHQEVSAQHPGWWMGLNVLGLDDAELLDSLPPGVAGLWKNDAGVRDGGHIEAAGVRFGAGLRDRCRGTLYFGGVSFKYQASITDPAGAARSAVPYVDVVTTSGAATGSPPDVEKIKRMKDAIGGHSLAIASGISARNVGQFLPYVDCVLVATSISSSFEELDAQRIRELIDAVN